MSDPKTVSCRIAPILNTAVFIVSVVWSNPVKGAGPVLDPALPEDQVVSVGGKVTQRVRVVSFSGQMAFQWWFGEEKLEGMTNVSLVYPAISAAQAGGYRVVVTDDTGSTTSRVAAITINPTFVKVLTGPVAEDREASVVGAWADDDLDGDQDLFVANNGGTEGARNTLYRNLGDGNFERLASHGITNQMAKSWGAAWGDYDNDGDPDLFVANWNSSGQLLRNDRNGQFTSVTYEWPLATREHIEGAWVDYDRDGWLDLYVVLWGRPSLLYRNLGDGRFDPLSTAEVGSLYESKGSPIGCAWADYDDDGDPDMLIDAPGGLPLLHRNMGNGRFESVGAGSLTSANATGEGMGWFDFNNDGRLDVLMVGQAHEIHLNAGGGLFTKGPALPVPAPADPFVTVGGDLRRLRQRRRHRHLSARLQHKQHFPGERRGGDISSRGHWKSDP